MASRAVIRSNTYIYLGTTSTDKAFPAASMNLLIQNAVNKLLSDIEELNPGWLRKTTTLTTTSTSNSYSLPADYAKWLDVRLTDANGVQLDEVRDDEMNGTAGYVFSLTGPDHLAVLTTGPQVASGEAVYLKYRYWPDDLADDTSAPDEIPRKFHDVVALEAAKMAFGTGGEENFPVEYQEELINRTAQLFTHVGRRGVESMQVRNSV